MPDRSINVLGHHSNSGYARYNAWNIQLLATQPKPFHKGNGRIRHPHLYRLVHNVRSHRFTTSLAYDTAVLRHRMAIHRQSKRDRPNMSKADDILFFDVI